MYILNTNIYTHTYSHSYHYNYLHMRRKNNPHRHCANRSYDSISAWLPPRPPYGTRGRQRRRATTAAAVVGACTLFNTSPHHTLQLTPTTRQPSAGRAAVTVAAAANQRQLMDHSITTPPIMGRRCHVGSVHNNGGCVRASYICSKPGSTVVCAIRRRSCGNRNNKADIAPLYTP